MGDFILCPIRRAAHPWFLEGIGRNIYSIEELCYLITQDLPLMDETVLNEGLVVWLRLELRLHRLAQRLNHVLDQETFSLAAFVIPIMKEASYLNQKELQVLEFRIRTLEDQPTPIRLKMKGDALLENDCYAAAIRCYRKAMSYHETAPLGSQLLGSLYNNLGCVYARLFQLEEACDCFSRAYDEIHTLAPLKSYLLLTCLKDGREAYEAACSSCGLDPETKAGLDREMEEIPSPELPEDPEGALKEWIRAYHAGTNA